MTKDRFNNLSQNELLACFNIVTHDGSDQYVIDWNDILEQVLDCIADNTGEDFETIDLTKYTNVELLRMYERLIARIIDGIPAICKVDIEDLF